MILNPYQEGLPPPERELLVRLHREGLQDDLDRLYLELVDKEGQPLIGGLLLSLNQHGIVLHSGVNPMHGIAIDRNNIIKQHDSWES